MILSEGLKAADIHGGERMGNDNSNGSQMNDSWPLVKAQAEVALGIIRFVYDCLPLVRGSFSLAIAGPWGCGKSHVMREVLRLFREGEVLKRDSNSKYAHENFFTRETLGRIIKNGDNYACGNKVDHNQDKGNKDEGEGENQRSYLFVFHDNLDYRDANEARDFLYEVIHSVERRENDKTGGVFYLCSVNIDRLLKKLTSPGMGLDKRAAWELFSSAFGQVFYVSRVANKYVVDTFWPEGSDETKDNGQSGHSLGTKLLRAYLLCVREEPVRTIHQLCTSFKVYSRTHAKGGLDAIAKEIRQRFSETEDNIKTLQEWHGQAAFALLFHLRQVMPDIYSEWVDNWSNLTPLFDSLRDVAEIVSEMPPYRALPDELASRLNATAERLEIRLFPRTADALKGDRRFLRFWRLYSEAIAMAWNATRDKGRKATPEKGQKRKVSNLFYPWDGEIYSVTPILSDAFFAFIRGTLEQ